jgi:DNA-binding response OmpR family regulator
VIEDDVETAELLANCVGNAGHVVDIAADDEDGLSTSIGSNR